jgi:hypothetical protein
MGPGEAVPALFEITGLPAPNDISIDPKDPSVLYVAGGTMKRFLGCNFGIQNCLKFSNPVQGKIYKVHLEADGFQVEVFSDNHLTFSGIEVFQDVIWVAQLFDIFALQVNQKLLLQKQTCQRKRWCGRATMTTILIRLVKVVMILFG